MFKKFLVCLVLFFNCDRVFSQDPTFYQYDSIRSKKHASQTLTDLENHLPDNHKFNTDEIVNWCHEDTHGINSLLRVKHCYPNKLKRTNAFYVLNNKFVMIEESKKVTLSKVALKVPHSLRGTSYEQYFTKPLTVTEWDDRPLYIFDEWVSFTNGSACCLEMNVKTRRASMRQMFNFNVYAICVAMTIKEQDVDYDDKELKAFIRWNIERSFTLMDNEESCIEYLRLFQLSEDAKGLRAFSSDYFGPEWTKKYFNF